MALSEKNIYSADLVFMWEPRALYLRLHVFQPRSHGVETDLQ